MSSSYYLQVQGGTLKQPLRGLSLCLMTSTVFTSRQKRWERHWPAPCRWHLRSTIIQVLQLQCEPQQIEENSRISERPSWFLCSPPQRLIWVSPSLTSPSSSMKQHPSSCWKPARTAHRWSTAGWQTRPTIKSNIWLTRYHPVQSWSCLTLSPSMVSKGCFCPFDAKMAYQMMNST